MKKISEAAEEELYQYDLIFLGSPSYQFLPPEPVQRFVKQKMKVHRERGDIKLCAPKIAGKTAVVFCTYSGPHTGVKEATPVGEYLGQFFEHIGFDVAAKWYIVGDFLERVRDLITWGVVAYPMRYQPLEPCTKDSYISPHWTENELEMIARARRVIGYGGAFPPYEGLRKKLTTARDFREAFELRPLRT